MTDRRREQGCIAVAIRWPLSTPCLKMTTLRFSESHSEVFEADGVDLTAQILRHSTTGLYTFRSLLLYLISQLDNLPHLNLIVDTVYHWTALLATHQPICLAARLGAAGLLYIYRPVKHHRVRIVPIPRTTV